MFFGSRIGLRKICSIQQNSNRRFFFLTFSFLIFFVLFVEFRENSKKICPSISNENEKISPLSKSIIFIGGMPRSGTTLMRAILDSHPEIRCGEETRIIPRILGLRMAWKSSKIESNRLTAAGINEQIMDAAVRAFIYETLFYHNRNSQVFCDKDPFVLKTAVYLSSIFPAGKFIFMVRDARAVVHSVITRKVTITAFSHTDYRLNFKLWNKAVQTMYEQCSQLTENKCLMVFYEQLVLQPIKTIRKIFKFINLSWDERVLHHEQLIGTRISLSKNEHSSDQVVQPINLEGLTKWVGNIPIDVQNDLDILAPMMVKLGYDLRPNEANYGEADELVLENMKRLKNEAEFWEQRKRIYAFRSANISDFIENTV